MTLYIFGSLLIVFASMNTDLVIIIALVPAYLFVTGVMIYYLRKISKRNVDEIRNQKYNSKHN